MSKKNNKGNNRKVRKIETEENKIVKRFLIILLVVIACIGIVYLLTKLIVDKDEAKTDTKTTETFDYDKTILGSAFNRPYEEYYIIAYKGTDEEAVNLSNSINTYLTKENHTKIYYADLDDYMNKKFYDEENVNKNATKASELKVGKYNLIKFKDGQITEFITDIDSIKEILEEE